MTTHSLEVGGGDPVAGEGFGVLGARLCRALTSSGALEACLEECAEALAHSLGLDAAAVFTLEPGQPSLELAAAHGIGSAARQRARRLPMARGPVGTAASERRTVLVEGAPEWNKGCGSAGFAAIPLVGADEVVGAIAAFTSEPLSPETLDRLTGFAHFVALGLERRRAGDELARSEHRFRTLFDHAPDYILVVDPGHEDGPTIVDVNDAACIRHGYTRDELVGMPMSALDAPETRHFIPERARRIMSGGAHVFEAVHVCKDGGRFPVEVKAQMLDIAGRPYVYAIERDITERKRMEAELARAQKIESLGVLAGGIAHDFNNLLTVVLGNLSLARAHPEDAEHRRLLLADADQAATRARHLTRQLLSFTKAGAPITRPVCVRTIVAETMRFALAGTAVIPHLVVEANLPAVEADEGQLSQLVSNLLINASQAMLRGGSVHISLERFEGSPDGSEDSGPTWVLLRVRDEGTGIDAAHLSRIFDPYFSTKEGGSGLGLASVYNIVKHHRGHVHVDSVPGEGTAFQVYLPAASVPALAPKEEPSQAPRGRGRILVLDDDAEVREVTARMVAALGYEVVAVPDGAVAVETYQQAVGEGGPFDLVLFDLTVVGGVGGLEALDRIRAFDPAVRAVVMSGYSEDPVLANHRQHGFHGALGKPFRVAELGALLSQVLISAEPPDRA